MEKASLSFKWTVWASLLGIVNPLLSRTLHIYVLALPVAMEVIFMQFSPIAFMCTLQTITCSSRSCIKLV